MMLLPESYRFRNTVFLDFLISSSHTFMCAYVRKGEKAEIEIERKVWKTPWTGTYCQGATSRTLQSPEVTTDSQQITWRLSVRRVLR